MLDAWWGFLWCSQGSQGRAILPSCRPHLLSALPVRAGEPSPLARAQNTHSRDLAFTETWSHNLLSEIQPGCLALGCAVNVCPSRELGVCHLTLCRVSSHNSPLVPFSDFLFASVDCLDTVATT